VSVDAAKIKHYYGIAIVDHPTLDKWGKSPTFVVDDAEITVLTTTHAELADLLTELSTAGDLVHYLKARAAFFAKHMFLGNSELDLLAMYKIDPEQFFINIDKYDRITIGDDIWKEFARLDARQRRAEMDHPSLLVDMIIDSLHECRHAKLPHVEERKARLGQPVASGEAYAKVAVELAKIRRINRRIIGEKLIEMSSNCIKQGRDRCFAHSAMTRDGTTVVFMVSKSGREERLQSLEMATMGALLKCNVNRVVGIVTEPVMGGLGYSVDAFMIAGKPDHFRKRMSPELLNRLLKKFGEPRKPDVTEFGGPNRQVDAGIKPLSGGSQ
jgi:hypothetical protein